MKITIDDIKRNLKRNIAYFCPEEDLAIELLKAFHSLGLEWRSGKSYLKHTYYNETKYDFCYCPSEGKFISKKLAESYTSYTVVLFEGFKEYKLDL